MATKKFTFDPDSGVSYSANLVINTGASFKTNFEVVSVTNSAFNFTGYTGSSQMAKSVSVGSSSYAIATFAVGFTSASDGKFNISLGSTATRTLTEGRYVYDILVSSGSTVYRIVDGTILVKPGISSAP
jgi:hypothetical protein